MELDLTALDTALLIAAGLFAGFVNTVAGGGSLITIPALAFVGLPWEVANASNRVAVLCQSGAAAQTFRAHGALAFRPALRLMAPALLGATAGAALASVADPATLEPLIIALLFGMAILLVLRPSVITPPAGREALTLRERPSAWLWLGAAGFYGGFIQAGVGYILLVVLGGVLRYDLVAGNAVKVVIVGAFTTLALGIFIAADLVAWGPALVVAGSSTVSSVAAVRFTVRARPVVLRWIVVVTLVATTLGVLLR